MPLHRDRRETPQGSKSGPPALAGRLGKPAGRRHKTCTGHQPAQRLAPRQRTAQVDQAVQMWSVLGLIAVEGQPFDKLRESEDGQSIQLESV